MQVTVETTGGLTRKMTIAVPSADFEGQLADRLKSTASKVSLPGFRRGKVPLKEVQRRFGPSLRREVATEVVQSSLEDAVLREKLPMVGMPDVELVNVEPGDDLKFTATFEVLPDVDLVDMATLTVRKPVAEITEADVDDMVESLRRQRVEWEPVERPAAAEDRVVVDYAAKVEGEDAKSRERPDLAFVVGAGEVPEELDAAVPGMSVGETRVFPVTIHQHGGEGPDQIEAIGEIVLKAVETPSLPELDDAFFAALGVDTTEPGSDDAEDPVDSNLAKFRDSVRERMNADLLVAERNETKRQVMAALARAHVFEVPRVLLAEELAQEKRRMAQFMGIAPEDAELGELAWRRAEERIRTRLIVREIVNTEAMKPDDERIRARIDEMASAYEKPEDVRNWIYGDEEQLHNVELGVLEDQLVDHVLSRSIVESVTASYEDVVTGRSIPPDDSETESARPLPDDGPGEAGTTAEDRDNELPDGGHASKRGGRLRRWLSGERKKGA